MLLSDIEGAEEKLCIIDSFADSRHAVSSGGLRHQTIGHAMVPIMVASNQPNRPFSAINCICLVTARGVIIDFELAPASATDLSVGHELLSEHQNKQVIGDKAYISTPIKEQLAQVNGIELITVPRRNQKQQISRQTKRWINQISADS